MKKTHYLYAVSLIASFMMSSLYATPAWLRYFPLQHYDQTIANWISPSDPDYDKPLLDAKSQQARLVQFKEHYVGSMSPWNEHYIKRLLAKNDIRSMEQQFVSAYSNDGKDGDELGYGENLMPHTVEWMNAIVMNMQIKQFDSMRYHKNNRAIAVDNLHVRIIPTDDVHVYNSQQVGQGYPFDNLQISALWIGTPVYVFGQTQDHEWSLVASPDYIGWVKSRGIAKTNTAFIRRWTQAANKQLVAMIKTKTALLDTKGRYLGLAYVGSVFPKSTSLISARMMVPVADANRQAVIKYANIQKDSAVDMPLTATPHHFAEVMQTMIGRPYGWGSMFFYNDCSAEMKSLMTPFAIWLPRHSSDQLRAGKAVDLSSSTPTQRLAYLQQHGVPFLTLIYVGGHVALYIGSYAEKNKTIAMTYQNVWGLGSYPTLGRSVIGKSVLFPMQLVYPEDTSLISQARLKYFKVSML